MHAKSYLGMFPTRQAAFCPGTDAGVTVNKSDKVEPGVTFLAGMEGERNIMKLGDGNKLHRWMVPFYKAIPNLDHIMPAHLRPMNESMTHIRGAHVYSDGSIVFNFDCHGLVSIDSCSNIQWTKSQMTHHAVTGAQDGTVWVHSRHHHTAPVDRLPILKPPFFEDTLLQLSRDGKVMREISLPGLMIKNDRVATLTATGTLDPVTQLDDFMHNNDIEILTADKARPSPCSRPAISPCRCVASALFLVMLERVGLVDLSLRIVADSREAVGIIADKTLDDAETEKAVQRMSARMLGHFAIIVALLVLACLVPPAIVWAGVSFAWTDLADIEATAMSLSFIAQNLAAFDAVIYWKRTAS